MTREQFEHEFHSRTLAYQPAFRADPRPVVVFVGRDANSRAGHTLLVGLVNQLARAHQHIVIAGATDEQLQCRALFGLTTVADSTLGLARAINPFIPVSAEAPTGEPLVTIAVGQAAERVDLRVGCSGWCATFGHDARIGSDPRSMLGAMLASCITATYAFHRLLGDAPLPAASYSLWNYGAAGEQQGPDFAGPLDVGRVLQVGAGGVGAALDYWAALLGVTGAWSICDADDVDVSNLNRQLSFLASDAGFPDQPAHNKAEATAGLLGEVASASPHWYTEDPAISEGRYDVVLALANDRGVRSVLQARQPPVLLHATTSANWEAQFHRHVAGRDDCINCRIPPTGGPPLRCAETEVDAGTSTDAALPFLSGAAGLLLLSGLIRLQLGELTGARPNFMSLNLKTAAAQAQHLYRPCIDGCAFWATPAVRRHAGRQTRYAALDPAHSAGAHGR